MTYTAADKCTILVGFMFAAGHAPSTWAEPFLSQACERLGMLASRGDDGGEGKAHRSGDAVGAKQVALQVKGADFSARPGPRKGEFGQQRRAVRASGGGLGASVEQAARVRRRQLRGVQGSRSDAASADNAAATWAKQRCRHTHTHPWLRGACQDAGVPVMGLVSTPLQIQSCRNDGDVAATPATSPFSLRALPPPS